MIEFLSYKGVLWCLVGCFLIVSALPVSAAGIMTSAGMTISQVIAGLVGEDVEAATITASENLAISKTGNGFVLTIVDDDDTGFYQYSDNRIAIVINGSSIPFIVGATEVTAKTTLNAENGLKTKDGKGISIGGTAPTTSALEISECDNAATITAPTDKAYILQLDGAFYFRNSTGYSRLYADDLFADDVLCTDVMTNNIRNRTENGPPMANFWLTDGTADDAEITSDTTLTTAMHFVRIDTSGGTNITIDLPASPVTGQSYHFKVTGFSGSITIDGNGKNIDGISTSSNLTFTNDRLGVIYDGTEWWITDNA